MTSITDLKELIDLHDLAEKLGLQRPDPRGNYRSPHHDDKTPSLSIYGGGKKFKDHSDPDNPLSKGSCIDLVMYVEGGEAADALRRLHDLYGLPMDTPQRTETKPKSRVEFIAEKCLSSADQVMEYLVGRGIDEEVVKTGIQRKMLGFNQWHSDTVEPGSHGYGGPAAAFVVRTMNPGHVVAVDLRYLDPELNGGTKTQCQGEKRGYPWFLDLNRLKAAKTVYLVESPINALSIDSCKMKAAAAVALRGVANTDLDFRFLQGKQVVICMDNDEPNERSGYCPGAKAAWALHENLTAMNIAAHMVDQGEWGWNDVNDVLQDVGTTELRSLLRNLDQSVIPGVRGDDKGKGKPRVYLPAHDYAQYWKYRAKEDFTSVITNRKEDDMGVVRDTFGDLCGFRVASISRVTVASATATMTGEDDNQPRTLFAVSVQAPRHGNQLVRRVFEDERLHNVDQWQKFGPIFNRGAFLRMVNILERGADLGARHATNFVGLAWRDGKPIVNQGPDCYFTNPEQQCPYHNLTFHSGPAADARKVIEAYQTTFKRNAAALQLVWAVGSHLKAFLGFWPHMIMQADKGMGKSTLVKRLERTVGFTMFSGQSLQTEFRLLTSISHTSQPVGWEEISARRQDVIDKAVSLLQECYQYTVSRRGSDMTEYLISAPVLLAGEDVPVRSLLGKVVRTDLTGKKGPMMPEDLPRFPMAEWLAFLAEHTRPQVNSIYNRARQYCWDHSRASGVDDGAKRMAGNYAAVMTAWRLLCEFAGVHAEQGDFIGDVTEEMNSHVAETSADREPWVWIIEILLSEISAGNFRHPFQFDDVEGEPCLCVRTSHIMDHISSTMSLRDKWNALPVKSDRVLKRQVRNAGVILHEDLERTINNRREAHLVGLGIEALERYGLHAAPPIPRSEVLI